MRKYRLTQRARDDLIAIARFGGPLLTRSWHQNGVWAASVLTRGPVSKW